ncbi:MAG: hypothetical protein DMG40_25345, partial [Acidobacteria bacterium]
ALGLGGFRAELTVEHVVLLFKVNVAYRMKAISNASRLLSVSTFGCREKAEINLFCCYCSFEPEDIWPD